MEESLDKSMEKSPTPERPLYPKILLLLTKIEHRSVDLVCDHFAARPRFGDPGFRFFYFKFFSVGTFLC